MAYSFKYFPSQKGSVLVFSLIILSLMLVSALSVSLVSVSERKSAAITERSNRSFQVADSGAELVLQKIYKGNFATLNALAASLGTTCNASGEVTAALNSGRYTVSFFDLPGAKFTSADCASTTWRSRLVRIKSEGTSGNTMRVVEVAVKAFNGLVGYWKFDEGSGLVAADSSIKKNDGSLVNGPTWVSGKVGSSALMFNGSTSRYVRPAAGIPSLGVANQSYTLSAWVRPTNANESGDIIRVSAANGWCLSMIMLSNGKAQSNSWTGSSSIVTGSTTLAANTWYYIAHVWDSSLKVLKVYVNGVSDGSTSQATFAASGLSAIVTIGAPGGPTNCSADTGVGFDGAIDDVRVYDAALSDVEIKAVYDETK